MSKEPERTGRTEYYNADDVPEKYKKELEAIIANVRAIHGNKFVQHVKFLQNMKSLLGLLLSNLSPNPGVEMPKLREMITHISAQLSASHAQACGLSNELDHAAFKTSDALDAIIDVMAKERNKRGP